MVISSKPPFPKPFFRTSSVPLGEHPKLASKDIFLQPQILFDPSRIRTRSWRT